MIARAATAVGLLVVGFAVGLAAVAVHGHWWGGLLGWAATLAALFALPPGLPRIAYAVGWLVPAVWGTLGRPTGGYAVAVNSGAGDALLTLGLVLVIATIVTMPVRSRRRRGR